MASSSTALEETFVPSEPNASDVPAEGSEESLLHKISDLEHRIELIKMAGGPPAAPSLGHSSEHQLPPSISTKVHALRNLQLHVIEEEVRFHQMAHAMEVRCQDEFNKYHRQISSIVNGLEVPELLPKSEASANDVADQPKGVPEFWLTVLKASFLDCLVHERDEPVLKALQDIRCVLKNEPQQGFLLEFHFASNDYFTNEVLTKEYFLRCAPDPDAPYKFNGFEIYHTVGCTIDWKPGHNLLEILGTENEDGTPHTADGKSFFGFFEPEKLISDDFDCDYNMAVVECDFHYGYYIKETVIPRAVFLFLGDHVDTVKSCSNCCCDRCLYTYCLEDEAHGPTEHETSSQPMEEEQPVVTKQGDV